MAKPWRCRVRLHCWQAPSRGKRPVVPRMPRLKLAALRVGRLDLLRGDARVVEAAPEVDGHLHWGGVKTHEARTVRLPGSITDELAAT